jgi:V/A-type H+-transporting ATPase subunit E
MAVEDILLALDEQCREECQSIYRTAQKEAEQILEKARREADEIREARLQRAKSEAESDTISVLYSARLKARNAVIQAKEEMVEEALRESEKSLRELRSNEDYAGVMEGWLKEGLSRLSGKIIVHTDPLDSDLVKSLLDEVEVEYEIIPDMNIPGGVVLSDTEGRVKIINTVEERLNRAREKLRMQVSDILFGEEES